MAEERIVRTRLIADIASYRAQMQQAARSTQEFGRAVTAGTRESDQFLSSIGRVGLVAGGALTAAFAIATRTTMNFDRQLSELRAVSGATAAEMDRLRQAALDAGAATAFSASEAAQAQVELAKAGLSTADILGGALTGALDLAAAGGLDLARAAEIAASTMTTFGLSGQDVAEIADALAAGANKSVADVDTLAQALTQVGLVADQMGLSMEETVGTLSLFSQNALNGSDAGTSFRTMLMRLSAPTGEARELMEELGIQIYTSSGQMRPFAAVAEELQVALSGLSDEERNAAMATIAGQDAIRALNILLEAGGEGVREWTAAVSESGFASDVAGERLDNLAGDLETLKGSLETALIENGSHATGVLRALAQGADDVVSGFGEMPGLMQGVGLGLGGITTAGLLTVGAFGTLAPKIREAKAALEGFGAGGQFLSRNLGRITAGLGVAGVAVAAYSTVLGRQAEKQAEAEDAARAYTEAIEEQGSVMGALTDEAALRAILQGDLGEAMRTAGADLDVFTTALRTQADYLADLAPSLEAATQVSLDDFVREVEGARLGSTELGEELIRLAESGDLTAGQMGELIGRIRDQAAAYQTGITNAENNAAATRDAGAAARDTAPDFETSGDAANAAAEDYERATDAIKAYADAMRASVDPFFGMIAAVNQNRDAQLAFGDAIRAVEEAEAAHAEAVREHGASSDEAADAARAYDDALRDLEQAHVDVAASALDVNVAATELAGAVRLGNTSIDEAVALLADWVGQGLLTAEQAMEVAAQFDAVGQVADELQGRNVQVTITADTADAFAELNRLSSYLTGLSSSGVIVQPQIRTSVRVATGGLIGGPNVERDIVPAMLMPGEFVMSKRAVQRIGAHNLHAMNEGRMRRFATGGPVEAAHAYAAWRSNMVGNLSGTPVGRNIVAAHPGDPESAARDLETLLDLYVRLSDTIGQAAADQLVFADTGLAGFEILADGALAAAEAAEAAAEEARRVGEAHERMNDVRFAVGDLGTDEYLAILRKRLAATEQYSDEWFDLWQQINRITEQAVAEQQRALDEANAALEARVDEFVTIYERAYDRHRAQQDAYAEAVAERGRRIVEETRRFADDIADTFADLANPLSVFGSSQDITPAQVEAALRHRVEATRRFAATYAELATRGLSEDVLTQLAQRGPEGLSLAEALLEVDPALVNEAMAETRRYGEGVAGVALGWERSRIQARVYAEVALPVVQSFNDLLGEEIAAWEDVLARQSAAEEWARRMAEERYPALAQAARDAAAAMAAAAGSTAAGGGVGMFDAVRAAVGLPPANPEAAVNDAAFLAEGGPAVQARIDQILRNAGVASYDEGGWLQPGWTLAFNGTGAPERVGGASTVLTVERGAVVINAPGADQAALERRIDAGFRELQQAVVRRVRN